MPKITKRFFLTPVLFLMTVVSADAIDAPGNFRHLFVKDGLLSGNVYAVRQGSDGCMWIATDSGLSKYNGFEISSYELESFASFDAGGNNDREWLFADSMGNIWVSYEYLALYDRETDSVKPLEWFPKALVTDYLEADGVLYVATDSGLFAIDIARLALCRKQEALSSFCPLKFCRRGSEIVMYTRDEYIVVYDMDSQSVLFRQHSPFPNRVADIECDSDGRVWIATNGAGLYCLAEDGVIARYTISGGLVKSDFIRALSVDTESMLWVGTGNGLSIIDTQTKESAHVLYDGSGTDGISNNSITSICRTVDGGMWLSNMGHGVDYFYRENNHFYNVEINNVSEVVIGGMAEDNDGSVWIGTSRHGAFHYWPATGRMTQVVLSNDPVKNDIKDIAVSADGKEVYFCTARYGFNIYNRRTGHIENYSSSSYPRVVSSVLMADERFLWIGCYEGVFLFDVKNRTAVKASPDEISKVYCMFRDSSGRYWLGTETALISCDMTISASGVPEVGGIRANAHISKVSDIREVNGRIYVATAHGLYCGQDSSEWKKYTTQDGLPSGTLHSLETDARGRIWIGTEAGLSCFDPKHASFVNFRGENGLPCNVFRRGASIATRSGAIYMGGFGGLVRFAPSSINNDRYIWRPMVSDITSQGKRIFPDKAGRVVLKPGQRVISLSFAVPNYTSLGGGVFAFRLMPDTKDWTASAQRHVCFPDLDAGEYTFELGVCNGSENIEVSDVYTLKIVVKPYWYETLFARIVFALLVLGAIAYLVYSIVACQRRKSRLEIERIRTESKTALDYRQARFYAKDILSVEDSKFLNEVIADVEKNLQNGSFSVETLSSDMCTCRSNLYRRIMSITGDTVQNLIKRIRLEKAIQLLDNEKYSVSRVSELVGFSSTSYFVTCFKKYTGRTPGDKKK